tara:strand:+ start:1737 stop:2591 length:855 start_codon:yes stop_codon:yes gene_type:complete
MSVDLGFSKNIGLDTIIEHARNQTSQDFQKYLTKIRETTLIALVKKGKELNVINEMGFIPLDCLRESISWEVFRKKYTMKEILEWGMDFDTAVKMGLKPSQLGGNEGFTVVQSMHATNDELRNFICNLNYVRHSQWSPDILANIGFTFQELIDLGCNSKSMKELNQFTIKNIVLAWNPTAQEWINAGFGEKDVKLIEKHGWDMSAYRQFICSKTCLLTPNGEFIPPEKKIVEQVVATSPQEVKKFESIIKKFPKLSTSGTNDKIFGENIDLTKLSKFSLKPRFS